MKNLKSEFLGTLVLTIFNVSMLIVAYINKDLKWLIIFSITSTIGLFFTIYNYVRYVNSKNNAIEKQVKIELINNLIAHYESVIYEIEDCKDLDTVREHIDECCVDDKILDCAESIFKNLYKYPSIVNWLLAIENEHLPNSLLPRFQSSIYGIVTSLKTRVNVLNLVRENVN